VWSLLIPGAAVPHLVANPSPVWCAPMANDQAHIDVCRKVMDKLREFKLSVVPSLVLFPH
jgi:protein involved in temperature-dependent protein secretion